MPVYIVHTSCEQAHEAIRRARQKGMRVYGEPLIQHLVLDESEYFNKRLGLFGAARDEPALPQQAATRIQPVGRARRRARCRWWRPTTAPSPRRRSASALSDFTKIPNGTGGLEDRMPVLWTRASRPGG